MIADIPMKRSSLHTISTSFGHSRQYLNAVKVSRLNDVLKNCLNYDVVAIDEG